MTIQTSMTLLALAEWAARNMASESPEGGGYEMKVGDKVKFIGASDEQVKWGSNDDPRKVLIQGAIYKVSYVEEHSWHTKISLVGFSGKFNSISFEVAMTDLTAALALAHEALEVSAKAAPAPWTFEEAEDCYWLESDRETIMGGVVFKGFETPSGAFIIHARNNYEALARLVLELVEEVEKR